ncbi:MAG: hypothetical protein ABI685_03550 [Ferruginibacter sp.]
MKKLNYSSLLIMILFACFACNEHHVEEQPAPEKKQLTYVQKKLDSLSDIQITIPGNYVINMNQGFDTRSYSLIGTDSSVSNFGNVEMIFTKNYSKISPRVYTEILKDSTRTGEILNSPVEWKIYQFENCVTAQASESLKDMHTGIEVFAKAKTYANLDSLIKIISSLKKTAN